MALVFDGIGYMKRLRDAGVSQQQAEAHAQAVKDYVMLELVTRSELEAALDRLSLRLTLRLGALIGAGIAILAAIIKL
ncbi:MAG: hypothetical protein JO267_09230 [Alphaproteobacteria bacterium]|nr:hypothetical protein [Alphaproteobacteria bacterium]